MSNYPSAWSREQISLLSREVAILKAMVLARDDSFLTVLKGVAEGHKSAADIYADGFHEVLEKVDKVIIEKIDEAIAQAGDG